MTAVFVRGGWISGNDLVDPLGRRSQYTVLYNLRDQDEAPLGELGDLLISQHAINVEERYGDQQRDFPAP